MMTQTKMEQLLENIDRRLARVEQKLPTLATKEDLQAFATKEDLQRCATREDLQRCATKEDLQRCATKEDLQSFATKEDLQQCATKEDLQRLATKEDFDESKRFARMLNEDTGHKIKLVGEGVSDLQRQFASLIRRLEKKGVI